jgi:predicted unusual protein kinase regulating ubiquinone biosynthesis (AarF/ABC1/UbiB family)
MFRYLANIFRQLRKIFGIKGILENIHNNLADENKSLEEQKSQWLDLKNRIFICGSLYVKFLQWYISKLKSNTLDSKNITYSQRLQAFVDYFEDIFENCPFHSLDNTRAIFAGEDGMTGIMLEKYIHMDTLKEIASGSIGQVYYARRKSDNREIAIKVKHPDIAKNLEEQLSLIRMLSYIQSFKWVRRRYNLIFSIDDFLLDINQQCDFNNEALNNKRLRENFKASNDFVVFPEVLFQSEDVLVSEYIAGMDFTSLSPIQQHMTTLNFICFLYQMLFVDNFIHGDLHCKNWKIHILEGEENKPPRIKIVVYDTGICFSNSDRNLTRNFWFALGKYDLKDLNKSLKSFVINSTTINNPISDEELTVEIDKMFSTILQNSIGTGMIMKSIINYCSSRNIMIDKFLLNLSITICLLEEFLKKTDMVDREKNNTCNNIAMYDIINDNSLDIIAFCQTKGCYPEVLEIFQKEMDNKYLAYQVNLQENNILENGKNNTTPILFNCLALSGLKMRVPGSSSSSNLED